jgi:hypothetical protein
MSATKVILVAAIALGLPPSLAATKQPRLDGEWTCNPYTMTGKNMTVTVQEQHRYGKDGSYSEVSTSTIKLDSGISLTTKSSLAGSWMLTNGVIELKFGSGEFLSSSNSNYTLGMGQSALDTELQKKNWSKMKILEFGKRLVTTPVAPMYEEAKVVVTCTRA